MTNNIILTIPHELKARRWWAFDVGILEDPELGGCALYGKLGTGRRLESLPTEFFNHELKEWASEPMLSEEGAASLMNLTALAQALSAYGAAFFPSPRNAEVMRAFDRYVAAGAEEAPEAMRLYQAAEEEFEAEQASPGGRDFAAMASQALSASLDLEAGLCGKSIAFRRKHAARAREEGWAFLVSDQEAALSILLFHEALSDIKEAAASGSPIPRDMEPVFRFETGLLNSSIAAIRCKVGFAVGGDPASAAFGFEYDGLDDGFLFEAVGAQFYNALVAEAHWRRCERCGEWFKHRRTRASRYERPHGDSAYCCDRCNDAARAKRRRDRIKQAKQAQQAQQAKPAR